MKQVSQKLSRLRELIQSKGIVGYIIPHNDAHDSEYISDSDERLAFVSGFTGSAGLGLVTQDVAYLWTDSRYFIQAAKQLELGWELQKIEKGVKTWTEYVGENLSGKSIGFDPLLMNASLLQQRKKTLADKDVTLEAIPENLIDIIWAEKAAEKIVPIFIHKEEYAGLDIKSKIANAFEHAHKTHKNCQSLLLAKLDQIAWILNLRGGDIQFNPVFKSYLYLEQESGVLFINPDKISEEVLEYLKNAGITVQPYESIFDRTFEGVLITEGDINYKLHQKLVHPINATLNPVEYLKAIKNTREVQGFRDSHIRDGAALVTYLAWLEVELKNGTILNEYEGALQLEKYRRRQPLNMGLSFATISSSGANAAVVHYHPEKDIAIRIDPQEIYLLDSGGQYLDGTTDVTRTMHFTQSTAEQRNAYTRVLLGNLDLERVRFPKDGNIHGGDLDVLARRWLWEDGLDYGHGTGHGVGYFLCVHEGPQGISKYRTQVLKPGMIVSNGNYINKLEPGYYKEGSFGIRIENLIVVVEHQNDYLGFENLTMCPYDRNLIDLDLLSPKDKKYLDAYHQEVRNKVLPLLEEQFAKDWLIRMTEPL